MDGTNTSQPQSPDKLKSMRAFAYPAIGLTLVVALMQLWGSLHGRPARWPELALLITLFCSSMASIVDSRRVKMILAVSGICFALTAIYGFVTT